MRRAKTHYPAPQQKRKRKRFHASQTQINQGTGEAPWLVPWYSCNNCLFDWPAEWGWFTSLPFRQNKSNHERTNDISYLEKSLCTIAGNKCEKRAKGCAKRSLIFPLDSLKSWYQARLATSRPLLASGRSLFWPRSGGPRATKSREHMKSDEGLFWKASTRLPIVQKEEITVHWRNFYPADDVVGVYLSTG